MAPGRKTLPLAAVSLTIVHIGVRSYGFQRDSPLPCHTVPIGTVGGAAWDGGSTSTNWSAPTKSPKDSDSIIRSSFTTTRTTTRPSRTRCWSWVGTGPARTSGTGLISSDGPSEGEDCQSPRGFRPDARRTAKAPTKPTVQPGRQEGGSELPRSSYKLLRSSFSSGVGEEAAATVRVPWDARSTPSTWWAPARSRNVSGPGGRAMCIGGGRTTATFRSPSPCSASPLAVRPTSGTGPMCSVGPASEASSRTSGSTARSAGRSALCPPYGVGGRFLASCSRAGG